METHQFFCVIAIGLERALVLELQEKGLPAFVSEGGVYTRVSNEQVAILTTLRTPTAIRWQLINGRAVRGLSDVRNHIDRIDWGVFPKGSPFQLKVSTRKSKLNRSDVLEEKAGRILRAILGPPDVEMTSLPIHIRVFENKMWISVSIHEGLLHQRGWRGQNVKTPIRENWAMALAYLAEHQPNEPILDPFCGSGTMLIESGRRMQSVIPHMNGPWNFMNWRTAWSVASLSVQSQSVRLFGSDRDEISVKKTTENALQAGVELEVVQSDIRDLTSKLFENLPSEGLILTNPPYGIGSGRRTDAVYHWLGETWRNHFSDWRLYFIAKDDVKAQLVSKTAERVTRFSNAGISVGFFKA